MVFVHRIPFIYFFVYLAFEYETVKNRLIILRAINCYNVLIPEKKKKRLGRRASPSNQ